MTTTTVHRFLDLLLLLAIFQVVSVILGGSRNVLLTGGTMIFEYRGQGGRKAEGIGAKENCCYRTFN